MRALHGDRDDPTALPAALDGWAPELVVDTSCQTRAAAANAAAALADVSGYAFVSSLNAYRNWPPGPIGPEDDEPTWTTEDDDYGPNKAAAERILGAALGDRFLTARAGLIVGPFDPLYRLGWWLDRIARGGDVVVPAEGMDQPIALVDARDLAGWLVDHGRAGPGRRGEQHRAGRHDHVRRPAGHLPRGHRRGRRVGAGARGGAARGRRPAVGAAADVAAGRAPPATAWDVDTTRARELGLPSRPLRDTVADTWAWQRVAELPDPAAGAGATRACRPSSSATFSPVADEAASAPRWAGRRRSPAGARAANIRMPRPHDEDRGVEHRTWTSAGAEITSLRSNERTLVSTSSPPDQRAEQPRRHAPDEERRDRRRDHAADEQPADPAEVDAAEAERGQESEARRGRHQELRGVDRADHLARLEPAAGQHGGRADRAPAASAERVDETGDQPERRQEHRAQRLAEVPAVEALEGETSSRKVPSPSRISAMTGVATAVEMCASSVAPVNEPTHAGDADLGDHPPVDVAEAPVADTGRRASCRSRRGGWSPTLSQGWRRAGAGTSSR